MAQKSFFSEVRRTHTSLAEDQNLVLRSHIGQVTGTCNLGDLFLLISYDGACTHMPRIQRQTDARTHTPVYTHIHMHICRHAHITYMHSHMQTHISHTHMHTCRYIITYTQAHISHICMGTHMNCAPHTSCMHTCLSVHTK